MTDLNEGLSIKAQRKVMEVSNAINPKDYSDGFDICIHCGGYNHLGKGFLISIVKNCPLCKPKSFKLYKNNPFILNGIGEHGIGENKGLRRAFRFEKDYYINENGLHLIREELIKL